MKIKFAMQNFVYVVFNEPKVVGVIDFLMAAMNGGRVKTKPHITIQGPFLDRITASKIMDIKNKLKGDQFLIGNPIIFETKSGVALCLKVQSKNLQSVWDKPDYPVEKYGFNPHITIYEGPRIEYAQAALDFLKSKSHRIELISSDFSILPYVSKQMEIFPHQLVAGDENAIEKMIAVGKVSSSFRAAFLRAIS
jgi:hypothetical protein